MNLTNPQINQLAGTATVSPEVVRRILRGEGVRPSCAARVADAARALGLAIPTPIVATKLGRPASGKPVPAQLRARLCERIVADGADAAARALGVSRPTLHRAARGLPVCRAVRSQLAAAVRS